MSVTRRDFLKCTGSAIVCISMGSLISGCGSGSTSNSNVPVIVFSDVHFNPLYDQTLYCS